MGRNTRMKGIVISGVLARELDHVAQQIQICLPSGFSRTVPQTEPSLSGNLDGIDMLYFAGVLAYQDWEKSKSKEDLIQSIASFEKTVAVCRDRQAEEFLQVALFNLGVARLDHGDYDRACEAFVEAAELNEKHKFRPLLYSNLGFLCATLRRKIAHEKALTKPSVTLIDEMRLASLRLALLRSKHNVRGEPLHPDARMVEQKEIGFSDREPLGSGNIHDCICVCVRNSVSGKVGIAHIDTNTDIHSLKILFDGLEYPGRSDETRFQVRLVGARFMHRAEKEHAERSQNNFMNVLGFLTQTKNVEIISAAVGNMKQPTSFVLDPQSFNMVEAIPDFPNAYKDLSGGIPYVESGLNPLRVAFDLTQSPKREPLLLSAVHIYNLRRNFMNEDHLVSCDQTIIGWLDRNAIAQLPQKESDIVLIEKLVRAYQESHGFLVDRIEEGLSKLAEIGLKITDSFREEARKCVDYLPVYVGYEAQTANKPLADLISSKGFFFVHDNGTPGYHSEWLYDYKPPSRPAVKVEQGFRPLFR